MLSRRRTRLRLTVAAAAVLSASAAGLPLLAQETEGGQEFTLDLSTSVRASDNFDLDADSAGDTILSETFIGLGYESVGRTQTFRFYLSDRFRFGDGPGAPAEADFEGINANLYYEKLWVNSRLVFDARLRTIDLSDDLDAEDIEDIVDDEELDPLTLERGTLRTSNVSLGFQTGIEGPIGAEFFISHAQNDYIDTTDPDLNDNETLTGEVALLMRPDTVTEFRLGYAESEYDEEDAEGTLRRTRVLTFGAVRQLNPVAVLSGEIGWKEIEEEWRNLPADPDDERGLTASLSYLRELPSGNFGIDLSHDVTNAGDRTDLWVSRVYDYPLGSLGVSVGVAKPENGDYEPVGRISYDRAIGDQAFGLSLASEVVVTSDSEIQRNTSANVSYDYQISNLDSVGFSLGYVWIDSIGGVPVDESPSATATAVYRRALTQDWSLETGYSYRLRREEGEGDAESNTLFLTLQSSFNWRP